MIKRSTFRKTVLCAVGITAALALLSVLGGCGKKVPETKQQNINPFCRKLKQAQPVNVLVIGDSISEPAEKWPQTVAAHLEDTYHSDVYLENVSMGGNGSYAGYVRALSVDDGIGYDLIIFCHGQNDGENSNCFWYEAMIRACREKYPDASMISVLESAQRSFTETITNTQGMADHYGIWQADTVTPFTNGENGAYDTLTNDGCHPNTAGQAVYAKVVADVIDAQVNDPKPLPPKEIESVWGKDVEWFSALYWIRPEDFEYNADTFTYTYTAAEDLTGDMGLDYFHLPLEKNHTVITAAGKELKVIDFDWSMWPKQEHISHIGEFALKKGEMLTVTLTNAEAAAEFRGLCISISKQ